MEKTIHQGRNVRRFREMLNITQEGLAFELGDDWNQKKVSILEGKETIDENVLLVVAKALKVPSDAIKNFDEQAAINIISSTLHDNAGSIFYNPTFNPLDKVVELYERMIKERDTTIEHLSKKK